MSKKQSKVADLRVIDNWLEPEDFELIKEIFTNTDTVWYLTPGISDADSTNGIKNPLNNYSFNHVVYMNMRPTSTAFDRIYKILETKLKHDDGFQFKTILRIKCNLYPRTETIQEHPFHVDNSSFPMRGALLYLNTNDGYTGFFDGSEVDSIENRVVYFDATQRHFSTNCTNAQFRLTLNINYV